MFQSRSTKPFSPGSRSCGGIASSLALHLVAGAAALYASQMTPLKSPKPLNSALSFVSVRAVPVPVFDLPKAPLPRLLRETIETLRTTEPADRPEAPPALLLDSHVEAQPRTPDLAAPSKPEPPGPKDSAYLQPKSVTVGAFEAPAIRLPVSRPDRGVDTAGFDTPAAKAAEMKVASPAAGAFDQPAPEPRPGTDRPKSVSVEAGFRDASSGDPKGPPLRPARAVADTGFGDTNTEASGRPKDRTVPREVQQTDFSKVQPAAQPSRSAPPPERIDIPVEVLVKPAPIYTNEARALRIEGEVSLAVEFTASGVVRVLRVVRGLGHGLDETAKSAAEQIQFKPAQSGGRKIDFRTIVHIVFRLT